MCHTKFPPLSSAVNFDSAWLGSQTRIASKIPSTSRGGRLLPSDNNKGVKNRDISQKGSIQHLHNTRTYKPLVREIKKTEEVSEWRRRLLIAAVCSFSLSCCMLLLVVVLFSLGAMASVYAILRTYAHTHTYKLRTRSNGNSNGFGGKDDIRSNESRQLARRSKFRA